MHTENSIVMNAPLEKIFETVADLTRWPQILPHYRWIRFLEQGPDRNIVTMAAFRNLPGLASARIPVQWTSELMIDHDKKQIRFHHLKAFTRGMDVVWMFAPVPGGTEVRILHDMKPTFPIFGSFITETIVGGFFVSFIAEQTLMHMKRYVEQNHAG